MDLTQDTVSRSSNEKLMKLSDNTLTISRELSALDEEVLEFTHVLDSCDIDYVIVSGYVAILTVFEVEAPPSRSESFRPGRKHDASRVGRKATPTPQATISSHH